MSATRWTGAYALLAVMAAVVFVGAILFGPYRAVQRSDYMTYHVAARIVLSGDGACLYDPTCQAEAERKLIGEEPSFEGGALPFNSPPWLAVAVTPLGTLPLPVGFAVFTLLGLALLAWGTWRLAATGWDGAAPRMLAVILVLTAWPTTMAIIRGQSTLLSAGLLGLSVGMARYRTGIMLGLSALKPTLGPLWAAWQVLGGHWRAVGAAAAVLGGLIVASAVVVSPQALVAYPSHLGGVLGADAIGVHPAEMVNWRGVAERLGSGDWLVIAGSLATLAVVGLVWLRTSSRSLAAAAAFLATPLVLPHANQHEFVLAALGILLAVGATPALRTRLATLAVALHPVLWAGVALDARTAAGLLFAVEMGWLLVVLWLALRPGAAGRPEPMS